MAGKYNLFLDGMLLALDDDGGEDIADFADSHGFDESVELFKEWLLQEMQTRRKVRAVAARRRTIRRVV